ncbi:MAG: hypothetical protein U9O94_00795 [Nanoarchaeota archaeon]|nr:hypothetical protein [Nanoarchaeota archaeon]
MAGNDLIEKMKRKYNSLSVDIEDLEDHVRNSGKIDREFADAWRPHVETICTRMNDIALGGYDAASRNNEDSKRAASRLQSIIGALGSFYKDMPDVMAELDMNIQMYDSEVEVMLTDEELLKEAEVGRISKCLSLFSDTSKIWSKEEYKKVDSVKDRREINRIVGYLRRLDELGALDGKESEVDGCFDIIRGHCQNAGWNLYLDQVEAAVKTMSIYSNQKEVPEDLVRRIVILSLGTKKYESSPTAEKVMLLKKIADSVYNDAEKAGLNPENNRRFYKRMGDLHQKLDCLYNQLSKPELRKFKISTIGGSQS